MHPKNKTARAAGALYVALGLVAPFSLLYVPGKLMVRGNAAATAANIRSSEMLFRLGIVAELTSAVVTVLLVMVLYRLFADVNKMQALALAVFGAFVSVPITFIGVANELAALSLVRGANFLSVFDRAQLDALALMFLTLRDKDILVNEIFWGLWLFPFGLLVMRSGFLPRILGIFLIINGFAYLAQSLTSILFPEYAGAVDRVALIPEFGEVLMMLWLLVRGAKMDGPPRALAPQSL